MAWQTWNVKDLAGQQAQIEIVDRESGPWGHINVDQVEFSDAPRRGASGPLENQPDFGTMGLAILGDPAGVQAVTDLADQALAAWLNSQTDSERATTGEKPFPQPLIGALSKSINLQPGQEQRITFVVAWCFPNLPQRRQSLRHSLQRCR